MTVAAYPKRLIEVDLPIKRISEHARREKSIRHGHISTLHIWWARRPLASCRAVICASLWPDPADPLCPAAFREVAARVIRCFAEQAVSAPAIANHCSAISFGRWTALAKGSIALDQADPNNLNMLRYALLDFIADFASWDNSTVSEYLEAARALTQAAHEALGGAAGTRPLVVDPFAGGGSIPLEALRVGADAFASDLNPVAVLINKVVLEYIPRYGQRLADEVRKWGQWINEEARRELAPFYPDDSNGASPIAYLWARTVRCEGPGCGAEVPLIRSLWLTKKTNRSVALKLIPSRADKRVDFGIITKIGNTWVNQDEIQRETAYPTFTGTVKRGSATCPCCGFTTPVARVREQLKSRRGGADDARLITVVTAKSDENIRKYRIATAQDAVAVSDAAAELKRRANECADEISLVPDEELAVMSGVFNAPIYGHSTWGSLFTSRQALTLSTLVRLVKEANRRLAETCDPELALAVQTCLSFAVDKQADYLSSLCTWHYHNREKVNHTFARQALPFVSDFVETVFCGSGSGNWSGLLDWTLMALEAQIPECLPGRVEQAAAQYSPLPDDCAQAFVTDPPYYNAVPYADLSDFFYVWLRRTIGTKYTSLFKESLSPKADEICEMAGWDPVRYGYKTGRWFELRMKEAMTEGRRILQPSGVGLVVFAHKTTSGWEAVLQAIIDSGWTVTGSWPIDTEMGTRLRAHDSAALASSIHLICRARENPDGSVRIGHVGDWRDLLAELPGRIHEWMPRLVKEGVVGADAIFACLGPALEIFSRYERVEKASGEQVPLGEYLEHVWAAVARESMSVIFSDADATGFEPDARLTAMWLWTLSGTAAGTAKDSSDDADEEIVGEAEDETPGKKPAEKGFALEFDAARKIAQGLGAHLERLSTLVQVKGDSARLLPVAERVHFLFRAGDAATSERAIERKARRGAQLGLFGEVESKASDPQVAAPGQLAAPEPGETVLDRLHQAMLLFGRGQGDSLRRFLADEGSGNDERLWRLAQALSALYPTGTDEKRWVDGVLARKKGLGF